MVNTVLNHRYLLQDLIGSGGMADVYRAHDKLLDRTIAVKILRAQFASDSEFVARFRQEALAAARLSHYNIVNIYDVGKDGEYYYIVMEYVLGETLKDCIKREKALPIRDVLQIGIEIAEALAEAHRQNIIHCDIKPHNILTTPFHKIKVADFGIARAVSSATVIQKSEVVGSVYYFSPEQAKGLPLTVQSDVYSLGIVLYEMLTGLLPFTGESPISIAYKQIEEQAISLRELRPEIPPMIEAIVIRAMEKQPEARYQSMEQMLTDLRFALQCLQDGQHTLRIIGDPFSETQILPSAQVRAEEDNSWQGMRQLFSRKNKKAKFAIVFAVIFLFFLSAGLTYFMYGNFWSSKNVTVPDTVGKQIDIARSMLVEKNLKVMVSDSYNTKVPPGQVISQSPEAGSVVKEQRLITLVVSKGGELAVLPDLRGLKLADAKQQIKNFGFQLGRVEEEYSNSSSAGTVISQSPRPPAQLAQSGSIDLVVSKGAEAKKINLPDFGGNSIKEVKEQIATLGLKVGTINEVEDVGKENGLVLDQNPAASTEVKEGTAINLTIVKSRAEKTQMHVKFTVPDGNSRQMVQIIATDANGRHVVYDQSLKPGEQINRTVSGTNLQKVQIYVNGSLVAEQAR